MNVFLLLAIIVACAALTKDLSFKKKTGLNIKHS